MRIKHWAVLTAGLTLAAGAQADHNKIDLTEVIGKRDVRTIELAETTNINPDSAQLLRQAPGADVNSNGPLTGIAQYRGMFGNRIAVQINGTTVAAGGPNWMDPPLSYAPSALLESLVVYRGIAPVSAGQETIGGAISAETWSGNFTSAGTEFAGRLRAGTRTNNDATLMSGMAVLASENQRLRLSAFTESADDARFPGGDILPTRYERDRYDVGYGVRMGQHTLQFDISRNETGDSGTPSLPMDIEYIDSDLFSVRSEYEAENWRIVSRVYASDIGHGMTNFHLRTAPMNGARFRRNIATGDNTGFSSTLEAGAWRFGVDGHRETHNSDISNPNNAMFFVVNFNEAERQVLGAFVERQFSPSDKLDIEVGLRLNRVTMDADAVNGTPAMMMPAAQALRDDFNAADRSTSDVDSNWVLKAHYQADDQWRWYAGLARKTRSPSYQERFLWLPLEATAGLADMRVYTGNLDLRPEVSHELEFGFDLKSDRLVVSPRVFYRTVDDYIQGTPSSNMSAVMFVNMMNNMNGTNRPAPLQFNNVDANLYGADVDWQYALADNWSVHGVVSYVRGERDDIDDNLYRISPLHAAVILNYDSRNWGVSLESHLYDGQDDVSVTNGEQQTPGYAMLNLTGYLVLANDMKLGFGVENLADREFRHHLGGYNRVMGNPDIAVGERVPGFQRNVFLRLDYEW